MTPELKKTLQTAWQDVSEKENKKIETFDLLDAIQKNGTSAAWGIVRKTGLPSEEFHHNLNEYKKYYFENKKWNVPQDLTFDVPKERKIKPRTHGIKQSKFVFYGSILILLALLSFLCVFLIK
jgi:ATP-dependent Clp protease ATP-binding subunit ClpA